MSTPKEVADNIEIFLFGKRFGNTEGAKHGPYILRTPNCLWQMSLTGSFELTFTLTTAPCFLHRWAQTVLLGIRYRRVADPMKEGAK
tara:strand:- start:154 stop:414 length:261 start_codon:yes stop_codon:yes gene_type:complete